MHFAHTGELAALTTAFCWTVTALAFESASKRVGSLAVNLIRLALAFVFLTVFCAIRRGHFLPTDATAHAWIWLGLSGLVGFTIGDLCLFRAMLVLGSRLSMLLMALVPSFTAIISWLLMGERLSEMDLLGMALTTGGVAWVVMERRADHESRLPRSGILLGIGGAIGQAVGLALSKYGMGSYDPFQATQIRVIVGAAGFAILFLVIGWWPHVFDALKNRGAMARTALGAVFGPFLGVSLSLMAVQHTQAGVAATIMALVPVLIIPPSVLIKKERVSGRAIAGALVAVGGVAVLFV